MILRTNSSVLSLTVLSLTALSLAVFSLAGSAAHALTVDEAVAKHIEAHGGEKAWREISSMTLTGQFTAFSNIHPFTLHRQRGEGDLNKFYSDQIHDDKRVRVGYNGQKAWMINGWMGGQAQMLKAEQPDYKVMVQDAELVTPFFDWKARGYGVELLDEGEVDGMPVLRLKLTRHGWEETWYLDPKTFLEVARDAPASEFGNEAVGRRFFDDFRQVGGILIPHYIETQWYTRHRVYEIENVEINAKIDDKVFDLPPPDGMGELLPMIGTWQVKVERRGAPDAPWDETTYTSTIQSKIGDAMLEEHIETADGGQIHRVLAFEPLQRHVPRLPGQLAVETPRHSDRYDGKRPPERFQCRDRNRRDLLRPHVLRTLGDLRHRRRRIQSGAGNILRWQELVSQSKDDLYAEALFVAGNSPRGNQRGGTKGLQAFRPPAEGP